MSDKTAPQFEHHWRDRIAAAIGARWAAVCNDDHDPQHCDVCRHYADAQQAALEGGRPGT